MHHQRSFPRLFKALVLFASPALLVTGCVSINLPASSGKKSSNVMLTEPTRPFQKVSNPTVDSAWQNKENGNTIAYLSECESAVDTPLHEIANENLAALNSVKILETTKFTFNDREAEKTTADGVVDGVPVKMRLLLFKKNGCTFTLSYVGRQRFYDSNQDFFEQFIAGFKVP